MTENSDAESNNTETTETQSQSDKAVGVVHKIREEISKAIIGQTTVIDEVLISLLAGGHVLLEGVPGLGKTLLVKALAKTFKGEFARIQFTPDLMPADIIGHVIYDMNKGQFNTRTGPIFTNLLLADEINRAPAKTQAALLEVMQEGQATIEGESMPVPKPFMTLATQNPLEQEGTYPLPEAQLDRFLLKIMIDYPDETEEKTLVRAVTERFTVDNLDVDNLATIVTVDTIINLQKYCAQIRIDQTVSDYAVDLVRSTRNWQGIRIGAGPRGGLALIRAGKAAALLAGRDYVTPDDIKRVVLPALRHRIELTADLELEGHTNDDVLKVLIKQVDAPRQ